MIRFFCTKCNRVKRFRKWPRIIENKSLLEPSKRIGQCDFHSTKMTHSEFVRLHRVS